MTSKITSNFKNDFCHYRSPLGDRGFLLTLFLLLNLGIGFSQNTKPYSSITAIYKLTDNEAKELYQQSLNEIDDKYFHTLLDTFSTPHYYRTELLGHYLFVKAVNDQLDVQLKSHNSIFAISLNNKKDFAIQVVDSLGNLIEDAEVFLGKKKIPFDLKTKTYRKRKKNKGGFLTIKTKNETLFLKANEKDKRSLFRKRLRRFRTSKVGRFLIPPWYFGKSKKHKGYIALNKPKFQPGDTVKIKGYFTNHKGKPLRKKLQLTLTDGTRYRRKSYFKIDLEPTTAGAYLHEFVLGDSLKLDQQYLLQFSFDKRKKKTVNVMSHRFYFEDYQLDEVDYFLRSEKREYIKDEPIIIFAEGKDKNNWTIPDGKVRIIALREEVDEFYGKEILIPDTLWEHRQDLSVRGETQILFPLEKLPNAKIDINLKAEFSNSNGELQTKEMMFTYDALEERIEVRIEDGNIVAECFVNEKSVNRTAELWMGNDDDLDIERKVQLPYKAPINPFYSFYYFETEKAEREFEYKKYGSPIDGEKYAAKFREYSYRTQDSVFVIFLNPNAIPFNFQLRTKNKTLTEAQANDEKYQLRIKSPKGKPCFLTYQYVWMGAIYEKEKTIFFEDKLLTIQTDQPQTVEPGEQLQIKVKVKDQKNKPRKNVNLTAGAINAQFDDIVNVLEPQLSYKSPRQPLAYNSFRLKALEKKKMRKDISEKWFQDLLLSESLYYRLKHPTEGFHMEYDEVGIDSFYQNIPQFAPYLVKDGKTEPIYMIYCNRQLVYYYDVDDNPPYSFVGSQGYNQIVIRGREFTYVVDSVMLKSGYKLEFSIDVDDFGKSSFAKNIQQKPSPPELTRQEKSLLRRKMLAIRNYNVSKKNYVWQNLWDIHFLPKNNRYKRYPLLIGPFVQQPIRFLEKDGWSNQFQFESNFIYEIQKGRERLYQSQIFSQKNKMRLPKKLSLQKIGAIIYSPKQIEIESTFFEKINRQFEYSRKSNSEKGSTYKFAIKEGKEKEFQKFAVVLLEDDTTFTIYNNRTIEIHNLQPKDYTLIIFSPTGNYIQHEFSIPPHTLMYQDLTEQSFTVDSSQTLFREIFTKYLERLDSKNENLIPSYSRSFSTINDFDFRGTSGIEGKITDGETGEEMIGANVVVRQDGVFVNGASTDIDGNYLIWLEEGTYDVEVSYTGYPTQQIAGVVVTNQFTKLDAKLKTDGSVILDEIVVTSYKVPLIRQDETTVGTTISSNRIRNLPTRNINAVAASTAGVSSSDIAVRGSRSNATDYYIDGIRVSGNLIGLHDWTSRKNEDFGFDDFQGGLELDDIQLRSQFSDYAYFHPNLITDQNGEAYFTVTFPDNITAWKTFVVGMDNKLRAGTQVSEIRAYKKMTAQLALPRFLVEGDETNIIGKSVNFTKDSFNITTAFKLGDEILKTNQVELKDALIEKTEISTPENIDSLSLSYLLTTENYSDGEERSIPIFQKGVEEANGVFKILDDEKIVETAFDSNLGAIKIRIEESIVNVLLEDLKYLKDYPYGCNEQTASRLIALLLEKEVRQLLGDKFEDEKKIIKAIRRLKKTQNGDGSWGWWQNGKPNIWMTTYVLKALEKAKQSNYKTEALEKGLVFLRNELEGLQEKNLLNALLLFSEVQQNLDYKKYLVQLDSTQNSLYDKFAIAKIRQANDLEIEMDSILKWKKATTFGGWYFGEENYHWYHNSTQITLLAHDIFQQKNDSIAVQNIQNYFLSKRKKHGWRNTIESASILLAILPDLMKNEKSLTKNKVQLTGAMNETVSEFPFEATFSSDKPLKINKLGNSPIFITAYQERWNRNPNKKEDIFKVQTHFTQAGKKTDDLEAAVAADLHVEVEVKEAADYVMIEIPIPAGCSYRSKPNRYFGRESHREYFKNRTAVFCESLPVGKYEFTIPLEPRFSGKYTLNPTKVEQMYFPVFYGRNEIEQIEVR